MKWSKLVLFFLFAVFTGVKPVMAQDKCAKIPVLMYHHIQSMNEAKAKRQVGLTTTPENFKKHFEYLKKRGYQVIRMEDLINFFDNEGIIPPKPVLITFDDAYEDNYTNAWPILKEYEYPATVFAPTGLLQNPDYLSWQQTEEMRAGRIYFGNHTWSHYGSSKKTDQMEKEIRLADNQLAEKGQNNLKIFAYPFGTTNVAERVILASFGYKAAFTTRAGKVLCRSRRLELPRVRVGNANLSAYGL